MYTSRSAVETYHNCPRLRFNQYHYGGKGLVSKKKSIPLVTGSAVHRGVEHLANRLRIGENPDVEVAVELAVEQYRKDCEIAGFKGKGVETDRQQLFTFEEQKALIEGLVRCWYLRELPQIEERYKVIAVERDIEPIEIAKDVWFQAKVDIELQEKGTGSYFNYSLKTAKSWDSRNEDSFKNDLQGITEIWAVEENARQINQKLGEIQQGLDYVLSEQGLPQKNVLAIQEYLKKQQKDKLVTGTRFCVLIKGVRKLPDYNSLDPDALWITYSPLIRGYKRVTTTSVEYAHSWFYPNSENKSGKSALGKGWEPFNVWESNISIKQWIEMLDSGEIQPECGDVIKQQVVTPVEYFRSEREIKEAIKEVEYQESRIKTMLGAILNNDNIEEDWVLANCFPHNRNHCMFHFGGICEYYALCWKPEVKEDPVGSGLYEIRQAHHKFELEGLKK